jgi:hypothetical protein
MKSRGVCRFHSDSPAPPPLRFSNRLGFTQNTNVQSYPRVPRLVHQPRKFSLPTKELFSHYFLTRPAEHYSVELSLVEFFVGWLCICRPGVQLEVALSISRSTTFSALSVRNMRTLSGAIAVVVKQQGFS